MCNIYSQYQLWESDAGVVIEYESNDDNDDGYPDVEIVKARYHASSLEAALQITGGKSHIGLYGQPVDVYLNGDKI